jgi:hypothetical protein
MQKNLLLIISLFYIFILSGCGGSGSDSGSFAYCVDGTTTQSAGKQGACSHHGGLAGGSTTPTPTPAPTPTQIPSFALQSAYKAFIAVGHTNNFDVSGTCSGSALISSTSPLAAVFEGGYAFSVNTIATINFFGCSPMSTTVTSSTYYDSNYNLLGGLVEGVNFSKFVMVPSPLPISVRIGDSANYGVESIYADNTKQIIAGQRSWRYVIETDGLSASTAIVNLIAKEYNASNQLLYTQQSRYRITANGTLSIASIDVQYSTINSNHLIYTAR